MDDWREYLEQLREGWRDPYYWADHQLELAAITATLVGAIGLTFKWLELTLEARMQTP